MICLYLRFSFGDEGKELGLEGGDIITCHTMKTDVRRVCRDDDEIQKRGSQSPNLETGSLVVEFVFEVFVLPQSSPYLPEHLA